MPPVADVVEPTTDPVSPPEPAPEPAPKLDPEPKQDFNWKAHLPEDLKNDKLFEQVKDFGQLAKNYAESQKTITAMAKVPKAEDPPEVWQKFYQKLGVPETSEGYEIKRPDMPEHVEFNAEEFKPFLQTAHSLHLTPRQTQGVIDFYGKLHHQHSELLRENAINSLEELRKEWGGATDRKVALAQQAIKRLGSDDVLAMLESSGLGNHPAVVKLFSDVAVMLEEDGLIAAEPVGGLSKEDAQKELAEIKNNSAYRNTADKDHQRLKDRATFLYQFLYN